MRAGRKLDLVEQRRRTGALLVDRHGWGITTVGIADSVCTALGDTGQQRLRCERPIDA